VLSTFGGNVYLLLDQISVTGGSKVK